MTLKEYLAINKISVADFARLIGVSIPAIYQYIAKKPARPHLAAVNKIIEATKGAVTYEALGYEQEIKTVRRFRRGSFN
jgi:predicted transcriptional regulator